jgi:hypothetical protein
MFALFRAVAAKREVILLERMAARGMHFSCHLASRARPRRTRSFADVQSTRRRKVLPKERIALSDD